jgi:hypothetical protein
METENLFPPLLVCIPNRKNSFNFITATIDLFYILNSYITENVCAYILAYMLYKAIVVVYFNTHFRTHK